MLMPEFEPIILDRYLFIRTIRGRLLSLMKHGKNKSLVVPFMTAGQVGKGRGAAGEGEGARVGRQQPPSKAQCVLCVCACV